MPPISKNQTTNEQKNLKPLAYVIILLQAFNFVFLSCHEQEKLAAHQMTNSYQPIASLTQL